MAVQTNLRAPEDRFSHDKAQISYLNKYISNYFVKILIIINCLAHLTQKKTLKIGKQ